MSEIGCVLLLVYSELTVSTRPERPDVNAEKGREDLWFMAGFSQQNSVRPIRSCYFGSHAGRLGHLTLEPPNSNDYATLSSSALRPTRTRHLVVPATVHALINLHYSTAKRPSSVILTPKPHPSSRSSHLSPVIHDAREQGSTEVDLVDKKIYRFEEIPGIFNMEWITRLCLAHNCIKSVPATISNLYNLEYLNIANNHLEELPSSISTLPKLKVLILFMNRLSVLPRGFGGFPVLEVLDLTYNNLSEASIPNNFWSMSTLRALYVGDNDFETIPGDVSNLKELQILSFRENDVINIPKEIGTLTRLRELHLQGNRITLIPPELGALDLVSQRCVIRLENNPWIQQIADQLELGVSHVLDFIRTEQYRYLYEKQLQQGMTPPPKTNDKSKKISRKT
ncbi:ras suppressor protein 1-like [Tropilaelaps mercedesae]|uniref:Ras suppressor protein 1-like n=1 Tax=Tropilaelaps mercedesae TaxID=418985 RepID=A0A1V9XNY3_9ACAR|nr:ras suppressor protein 1-like [Tropilaelaps mercedesae]